MIPFLAQATPGINTMWIAAIAAGSLLANCATVGLFLVALKKTRAEVTFGFVPASKHEFDDHVKKNQADSLEVFTEINRLKAENLEITKEIGQITNQTLATLANAQKILRGQ